MVHENPDELGYWMRPLGRDAPQEDIWAAEQQETAEIEALALPEGPSGWVSYTERYMYDLMPAPKQAAIVKAAQHPEDSAIAEQHRKAAGYEWHLDPGWG